jgi:hypothetical protein
MPATGWMVKLTYTTDVPEEKFTETTRVIAWAVCFEVDDFREHEEYPRTFIEGLIDSGENNGNLDRITDVGNLYKAEYFYDPEQYSKKADCESRTMFTVFTRVHSRVH